MSMFWQEVPGGQGPCLLMIHGMLSSGYQWSCNVEALKPLVRPVLLDLWGHGRSAAPSDPALYTVQAFVDALERIREQLQLEQWLLCTQSFGAGIGLHYCLQHPQRVLGHVFTNSISALGEPGGAHERQALETRLALVREGGQQALRKMPFHPRNALRLPADVRATLIRLADASDPQAFALITEQTRPVISARARLGEIVTPTLLINGRFEKRFQPLRDDAARLLPGLQIVDIDAGHAVNIEQPQAFNEACAAFLSRVLTHRPNPTF
ncbi:MAG: alpha/beta fold hydrolase [Burkholderiaceae bacterium]